MDMEKFSPESNMNLIQSHICTPINISYVSGCLPTSSFNNNSKQIETEFNDTKVVKFDSILPASHFSEVSLVEPPAVTMVVMCPSLPLVTNSELTKFFDTNKPLQSSSPCKVFDINPGCFTQLSLNTVHVNTAGHKIVGDIMSSVQSISDITLPLSQPASLHSFTPVPTHSLVSSTAGNTQKFSASSFDNLNPTPKNSEM